MGQLAASVGFLVYSASLANWVFVATNALLVLAAAAGIAIHRRNARR